MFFMMGINQERKDLDDGQLVTCELCGSYGRYIVFMTCSVLSLFLIPIFRSNKRYYVEMSCCHSIYELNEETGKRIENGEGVTIKEDDLTLIQRSRNGYGFKKCYSCGYETNEDFEYCPKCGNRFN